MTLIDLSKYSFYCQQSQTLNAFARKFEAIVNQEIINMLHTWLYGEQPKDMPGLHSYWENVYNEIDDGVNKYDVYMTFYQSFARQVTKRLAEKSVYRVSPIWKAKEAHYYTHRDIFQGVLVMFDAKVTSEDGRKALPVFEAWAHRINMSVLYNHNMSEPGSRLKDLKVSLLNSVSFFRLAYFHSKFRIFATFLIAYQIRSLISGNAFNKSRS